MVPSPCWLPNHIQDWLEESQAKALPRTSSVHSHQLLGYSCSCNPLAWPPAQGTAELEKPKQVGRCTDSKQQCTDACRVPEEWVAAELCLDWSPTGKAAVWLASPCQCCLQFWIYLNFDWRAKREAASQRLPGLHFAGTESGLAGIEGSKEL